MNTIGNSTAQVTTQLNSINLTQPATVSFLFGDVYTIVNGVQVPITSSSELAPGMQIFAGNNSVVVLSLSDGSVSSVLSENFDEEALQTASTEILLTTELDPTLILDATAAGGNSAGAGFSTLDALARDGSETLAESGFDTEITAPESTNRVFEETSPIFQDTTPPSAPTVEILDDLNNDAVLNQQELDGKQTVRVRVTPPDDAVVGDTLNVTGQPPRILTQEDLDNGVIYEFARPPEGEDLDVTATVTDVSGNTSAEGSDSAEVDTTADNDGDGFTVSITGITEDTGIKQDDFITKDNQLIIFGAIDIGDNNTLTVKFNGKTYTTADNELSITNGVWTLDVTGTTLPDATYPVEATVTDVAGNTETATQDIVVDTQIGTDDDDTTPAVTVDSITEDTGAKSDDFITKDNTLSISGKVDLAATDTLTVKFNGKTYTTADNELSITNGVWTLDVTGTTLPDATYPVEATVTDVAGNTETATQDIVVDTQIGTDDDDTTPAVTVDSITEDTGAKSDDFITKDNTLSISGKVDLAATDTLTVKFNGKTYTTADNELSITNGVWTLDVTGTTLPDATYPVEATVTDVAGNTETATQDIVVDTQIGTDDDDTTPAVTVDSITEDTGAKSDDFITKDNTLSISGKVDLAATDTLTVKFNGKTYTTADNELSITNGVWTLDVTGTTLPDATYPVEATVTDVAGNTETATQDIVVDTQIGTDDDDTTPAVTVDSITEDTGAKSDDFITKDNTLSISGKVDLAATDTLTVKFNGKTYTTADNELSITNGVWTLDVTGTTLPDATYPVEATVTDVAGNTETATQDIVVDTQIGTDDDDTTPAVTVDSITEDTGAKSDDFITKDNTLSISGKVDLAATDTLTVKFNGKTYTTADNELSITNGVWTLDVTGTTLPDATYPVEATVTDVAGNTETATQDIVVDTQIGTDDDDTTPAVTVDSITEDTGAKSDDFITKDNTLSISGKVDLAATDTLTVKFNGKTYTTADNELSITNGVWTLDVTGTTLPDATYPVEATVTDVAGNTETATQDIVVDTQIGTDDDDTTPAVTVDSITEDTGAKSDDFITKDNTLSISGKVDLAATDTLTVKFNGKTYTTADNELSITNGVWTLDVTGTTLPDATYPVEATVTDVAGNTETATQDIVVDTQIGTDDDDTTPAVTVDSITEDTGAKSDDFITKDNTLSISGKVDLAATDTLTVKFNGKTYTTADNELSITNGVWTLDVTGTTLPDATYPVEATVTDVAGNTETATQDIVVDTQIGTDDDDTTPAVTVDSITEDTGAKSDDFITKDNTLSISGKVDLAATDTLTVKFNGKTYTTADNELSITNGVWTLDVTGTTLPDATYPVEATVTDVAGNTETATQDIVVDTQIGTDDDDTTPAVTVDSITEDTGAKSDDFITKDNTLSISGKVDLAATDTLTVKFNGKTYTTADNELSITNGVWTLDVTGTTLPDATYPVEATVTDVAGNTETATQDIVVDTQIGTDDDDTTPAVTVDSITEDTGAKSDDFITKDNTLSISGKVDLAATDTLTVKFNGKTYTTADNELSITNGVWTLDVTGTTLPDATYPVEATVTDVAGNTETATQDIVVDTQIGTDDDDTTPAVTVDSITEDTGAKSDDFITKDNTLSISGKVDLAATDTLTVKFNGKTYTTADNELSITNGVWTLDVTGTTLPDATYPVEATVTDVAGNTETATQDIVVDTQIGTDDDDTTPAVTVDSITEDTGAKSDDFITKDNTLSISGKVDLAATDTLTVKFNGKTYTTADNELSITNGVWTLDVTGTTLPDATYPVEATVTDVAGNTETATQDIVVDTTYGSDENSLPAIVIYDDNERSPERDVITGQEKADIGLTLGTGTTNGLSGVGIIKIEDVKGGSVTLEIRQKNGNWVAVSGDGQEYQITQPDLSDNHFYKIQSVDVATLEDGKLTASTTFTDQDGNKATNGNKGNVFDDDVTKETTPPTLDIDITGTTVTFTFSEKVKGFEAGDVGVTNGSISNLTQDSNDPTKWTATLTPNDDHEGSVTVTVADNTYTDEAGNDGKGDTASTTVDTKAPTLDIDITGTTVTFTFSEKVKGFEASDVGVTNGSISNLTQDSNDPTKWTATLTPNDDHEGSVTVTVADNTYTDEAGNDGKGDTASTTVDTKAPTLDIDITGTTVTFTFSEKVKGFEAGDVGVTNGSISNLTQDSNDPTKWTATLTPNDDHEGSVTVTVADNTYTDEAGNDGKGDTASTTVDTKAPTLDIDITGTTVTFTFSEKVKGFEAGDVGVTNGSISNLTQDSNDPTKWTATLTPNDDHEGSVTVTVADNTYTDEAGNDGKGDTASTTVDTKAPTLDIDITGTTVTFTFSEKVKGFEAGDVGVTNGSISNLTQDPSDPTKWTATLTPNDDHEGSVTVTVADNTYTDEAGNDGKGDTASTTVDTKAPTLDIDITGTTVTFTFSEKVKGFEAGDVGVTNGSISNLTQDSNDPTKWTATLTPNDGHEGSVTVTVADNTYTDEAGNDGKGDSASTTVDTKAPTLDIDITGTTVTFTFSEKVKGFEASDVGVTNGSISNLTQDSNDPTKWTATLTPNDDHEGSVTVTVADNTYTDEAGNDGKGDTASTTVDTKAPTLDIDITGTTVTFTFSEKVKGFEAGDVGVTNGSISNLTQDSNDPTKWTATLTPNDDHEGSVTVTVADNTYTDEAGNDGKGDTASTTVDTKAPTLDIDITGTTVTFTFSEKVKGFEAGDVGVTNGSISNLTQDPSDPTKWTATLTPNDDHEGSVTVTVADNTYTDEAGNDGKGDTASTTVDTKAPTLDIDITGTTVTFTFSEKVKGFEAGDVGVTNGSISNLTQDSNDPTKWTATLTPNDGHEGSVTVTVADNTYTDEAGNDGKGDSASTTVDTKAPTLDIDITGTTVTFTFSEKVKGFEAGDVGVTNGSISNLTQDSNDPTKWTATLTPNDDHEGSVTVTVADNTYTDEAGNDGKGDTASTTVDTKAPTLDIDITGTTVTFTFSEKVKGFEASDVGVINGSISNLTQDSSDPTKWTATLTPNDDHEGSVTVTVADNTYTDEAGNDGKGDTASTTVDTKAPTLDIDITGTTVTFTFSEKVKGFEAGDVGVTNGSISNLTQDSNDPTKWTATLTPNDGHEGSVTVTVADNTYTDEAGNDGKGDSASTTVDTKAPTLDIDITGTTVTFTFSEKVKGFEASDVGVTNGSISNLTQDSNDPTKWTATLTPNDDHEGSVTVTVADNTYTDEAGNDGKGDTASTTVDTKAPTLDIDITGTTVTFTFSEKVKGFEAGDVGVTNGSISNLTQDSNDPTKWTATLTPNDDHEGSVTVTVADNTYTDEAGNDGKGDTASTTVDTKAPTLDIDITGTTVTFTFSEKVKGFEAGDVGVTNGSISNLTQDSNDPTKWTATLTPNDGHEGSVTVTVADNTYTDEAGNDGKGDSASTTVDTKAPTLDIDITGTTVTFTFSEKVKGFEASDVGVTNGSISNLTQDSNDPTKWTATLTPNDDHEGSVTVTVADNTYTDEAGNDGKGDTASTTVDTKAPTLDIDITGTTVTFTFSEKVKGFEAGDVGVTNGSISNLTQDPSDPTKWTATLTPNDGHEGSVTVTVADNTYTDEAGNDGKGDSASTTVDTKAPTLDIDITGTTVTFTFSEKVKGFEAGDVGVTNGSISNLTQDSNDPTKWTATLTPNDDHEGSVTVTVADNTYTDEAGNDGKGDSASTTVDTKAPTLDIDITGTTVTFTFSEKVKGFEAGDVGVTNGSISNLTQDPSDPTKWTATLTPNDGHEGSVTVTVADNTYTDEAGNDGKGDSASTTVDTKAPTLDIDITGTTVTFTFSEKVKGFEAGDVGVTNGSISNLTQDPSDPTKWTATLTPNDGHEGSVTVTVADNTYTDEAGNDGKGDTASTTVDTKAPDTPIVTIVDDNTPDDGTLTKAEIGNDNVQLEVNVNHDDLVVGGTVNLTINNGGVVSNIELTLQNGTLNNNNFNYDNGKITWTETTPENGKSISVSATQTDKAGNTSQSGSDTAKVDLSVAPVFGGVTQVATVSDEGLANANKEVDSKDSIGSGKFVVTDENTSDTITATFEVDSSGKPVFEGGTPAFTSEGSPIEWSLVNNLLVGKAGGETVLEVSIGSSTQVDDSREFTYTVKQLKPIDHPDKTTEDSVSFKPKLKISDGNSSISGAIDVAVEDDSPSADKQSNDGSVIKTSTNLQFIIDTSGSIDNDKELTAIKDAAYALIDSLDASNEALKIQIVSFGGSASKTQWFDSVDAAKAHINSLQASGSTHYGNAIDEATNGWDDSALLTNANNVSYFLSDGRPSSSDNLDTYISDWHNTLDSKDVVAHAVAVDGDTDNDDNPTNEGLEAINKIAYDGLTGKNLDGRVINFDEDKYSKTNNPVELFFKDSVTQYQIISGQLTLAAGADGLKSFSVTIGSDTFTYDVSKEYFYKGTDDTTSLGKTITALTSDGKILTIDKDGNYSLKFRSQTETDQNVSIDYTITDKDGDNASNSLEVTIPKIEFGTKIISKPSDGEGIDAVYMLRGSGTVSYGDNSVYPYVTVYDGTDQNGVKYGFGGYKVTDGNNYIDVGLHNDHVDAGAGHDVVYLGDSGNNNPAEGFDFVNASTEQELKKFFTAGEDSGLNGRIASRAGADVASAGSGNDTVYGQSGTDIIAGGSGNDTLDGGIGIDFIRGGSGSDAIIGGAGNDYLRGGSGSDNFIWGSSALSQAHQKDAIVDFNLDDDTLTFNSLIKTTNDNIIANRFSEDVGGEQLSGVKLTITDSSNQQQEILLNNIDVVGSNGVIINTLIDGKMKQIVVSDTTAGTQADESLKIEIKDIDV